MFTNMNTIIWFVLGALYHGGVVNAKFIMQKHNNDLDLSSYGYQHVHDTANSNGIGWLSWPPDADDTNNYIKYESSSLKTCAKQCSSISAPSGSYNPQLNICYCYFISDHDLCREPCIIDSINHYYIDFSTTMSMEDRPYCNKSICNVNWYYDEVYCESVDYNEVTCNEEIEKLQLIEEEYTAMSGGYEEEQVDETGKDDEDMVASNKKKTATTTTCILIRTGPNQSNNGYLTVYITTEDNEHLEVTPPNQYYETNSIVLQECYNNLINIQVSNSDNDGWAGSIEASINDMPYYPMICTHGCTTSTADDASANNGGNSSSLAEYIVVDGNDETGSIDAPVKCLNGKDVNGGNVCLFSVATEEELVLW